jgi:Family of unknown function (DUF6527)
MRFHNWLRQFWAWIYRAPKPDFTTERVATHPAPDRIKSGKIVVVGDRQIQKWACFQCPGGCGEVIKLSLNHNCRPCWSIQIDRFDRPTISPSIRQTNDCQCHFWIRSGQVEWCSDSGRVITK